MEAAFFFEPFATAGQISDLHRMLLTCYVKANSRKKARDFLKQLPVGWMEDDTVRRLAMDLGQKARDWKFLLPLVNTQAEKTPTEAISWLFKLHVARHVESPAIFQDMVRQVPIELRGSIHNIAQLAGLELRHDEAARGLIRLYRLVRQNFEDPDAFSAYFISIVGAPDSLPMMEKSLSTVMAGSTVTLLSNTGQELQIAIDPLDIGLLPKKTGFFSPNAPEVASWIGAAIGQTVEIPDAFGGTQKFTVVSIQSVYRWMVQIAAKRAEQPGGLPHIKAVPVGISGGSAGDLTYMHEEVKRSTEIVKQIIEAYRAGYLTLSCLAKMQGRSPVDISFGWPSDAPPIFVGIGLAQERDDAQATLSRPDGTYVIDSLTLAEFLTFGISEALAALPKLYISPVTMGIVEDNLRESYEDKSSGMVLDIDGQLRFIRFDEKYKERRITNAQKLVDIAHKYCEVQPAYSELALPPEASQFVDILQEEEREMLLLAKEYDATLLTVDGRLRMLAKVGAGLDGVWPQALVMHCLHSGQFSPPKSAEFTIKQFLGNRKFVSVSSYDLVWMVLQGGSYIQQGIQAFKQQLQDPETEFNSSTNVAWEFLETITTREPTLGAVGELLVHIMESIFRHKNCPTNFHKDVEGLVLNLLGEETGVAYMYPPAKQLETDRINLQRKYLFERLKEASERSLGPIEIRPIAIRVLYCTKTPCLILDKSISKLSSNEPVQIGKNHKPLESLEPTLHTSTSLSPGHK